MSGAKDYRITPGDAASLAAISLLPADDRRLLLQRIADERGLDALVDLFSAFIGLANSVVENTRDFVELYLICECLHDPRTAEHINLPTIIGALQGVRIAIPTVRGMCHGCAFRLGTVANQSPITSLDAEWSVDSERFMCHEDLDERGQPTRTCAGFAAAVKQQAPWRLEEMKTRGCAGTKRVSVGLNSSSRLGSSRPPVQPESEVDP